MMTLTTGPAGKHARWLRAIALALLALLLADLTGAQEIYRCPSASGVAVFQQMPCTGGQVVEVGTLNVIQSQMPSPEVMRDMHVRRAIARGELVAGMTEQEVRQVMGTPSAVNRSASVHGSHDQLVYRGADGSRRYVYLRDGGLEAVSSHHRDRPSRRHDRHR